jgi:hypothetical protein
MIPFDFYVWKMGSERHIVAAGFNNWREADAYACEQSGKAPVCKYKVTDKVGRTVSLYSHNRKLADRNTGLGSDSHDTLVRAVAAGRL